MCAVCTVFAQLFTILNAQFNSVILLLQFQGFGVFLKEHMFEISNDFSDRGWKSLSLSSLCGSFPSLSFPGQN